MAKWLIAFQLSQSHAAAGRRRSAHRNCWCYGLGECCDSGSVYGVESAGLRAVEIDDRNHRTQVHDRHDQFRPAGIITGDMAGKSVNVGHALAGGCGRRRSAHAAT